MRVIPPLTITDAMLTSTTAPEPGVGEAAWASGSTYSAGDKVILGAPTATVTMTIASPCVITWTANGLANGTVVALSTTGALPTGLMPGVRYYVVNRSVNSFQLSATIGGAPIVTSGSQSGTHTATASIHRVFQSVVGSNTGNSPALGDTTKWLDIGPTNRWAMLDLDRNTGTTIASPLTVVLTPGQRIDAIALVGLVADTVTVTVTVGGVTKYTVTLNLLARLTVGWYSYFFGAFRYREEVALFDLPPYTNAVITVTITRATGNVSCGGLVIGRQEYLGATVYSPDDEALNFSKVDRDAYGTASISRRRSVPRITAPCRTRRADLPRVRRVRDDLNATVALWCGIDDQDSGYFPSLLILGFYKKFAISLDRPLEALLTLELEEV